MLSIVDRGEAYEPDLTRYLTNQLHEGLRFVDVGANEGWFTLLAASRVGTTGKVHAFEPNPRVATKLRENVAINGFADRVTVHECALGASEGRATIYAPPDDGQASLVTRSGHPIDVPIRTLDTELMGEKINLIKIDAEGVEDLVLKGGVRLISENKPTIAFEYSPYLLFLRGRDYDRAFTVLRGMGYCFALTGSDGCLGRRIKSYKDLEPRVTMVIAQPKDKGVATE